MRPARRTWMRLRSILSAALVVAVLHVPAQAGDVAEANLPNVRPVEILEQDDLGQLMQASRAEALRRRGACAEALPLYARLMQHAPDAARAGYRHCAIAAGRLDLAKDLVTDPGSADAVLIDVLSGAAKDPETRLRTALQTHADDARLWNALGRWLDGQARHAQARNAYAMAESAGQRAGLAQNNIGQSFFLEGRFELAAQNFSRAVAADPDRALYDNNRRRALALAGHYQAALAGLASERAALLLRETAELALGRGERQLAGLMLERAEALNPRHDPRTAALRARLNARLEQ